MTTDELLKKVKKLHSSKKYKEVIELLTKEELEKSNNARLYFIAGYANSQLSKVDESIDLYTKCIGIDPDYILVYNNRGKCYNDVREYDKAIADLNIAIEKDASSAIAYNNRGNSYNGKRIYDKALADYSKSIELKPDYGTAYYNRGNCYNNISAYAKAIEDYSKAIQYNPEYSNAYSNRGVSYKKLGDTLKAVDDYNKAIQLNQDNYNAHNNRGVAYVELKEYSKAISDYRKAISIKQNFALAWRNLGDVYSILEDYREAEKAYSKAVEFAPANSYYKTLLDETRAKRGEVLRLSKIDNLPQYAQLELSPLELDEEFRKKVVIACSKIFEPIRKVKTLLLYTSNLPVVHYTSRTTTDILVRNESTMRYNNGVFMNDPEEGKIFMQYVNDGPLTQAAINGGMESDNNVYIGSFMPHDKDDYLVMWRTYGKNPGEEEATGCSITIDKDFFDKDEQDSSGIVKTVKSADGGGMFGGADGTVVENPQVLYHVLYYDKKEKILVRDGLLKDNMDEIEYELKSLIDSLKGLLAYKNEQKSDLNTAIDKIIYRFVSELSYLFKSADYQTEQEVRVVKYHSPDKPIVIIDDKGTQAPFKVFIESNKPLRKYIRKIVMGPKVPHPERWLYLDVTLRKLGVDCKLQISQCRFQ